VSESPHGLMKLIGGFSKCHGVCGNNNEVSFVTNLLVLHVTNTGKFRLNMNFGLSFIEEETNKLLRRSNMFPFSISTLATHNSYKTADDIS